MKPLLLIDVDGPLNPWAAKPNRRPDGYTTFYANDSMSLVTRKKESKSQFRVWVNSTHGESLMRLSEWAELAWCTTWQEHANSVIAPRIGLPDLPSVPLETRASSLPGLYWKTIQVLNYVEDRSFIWLDDETTNRDKEFFKNAIEQDHELYIVNPAKGLRDADFEYLERRLRGLGSSSQEN